MINAKQLKRSTKQSRSHTKMKEVISEGMVLDEEMYNECGDAVKRFLNYRPGRDQKSIFELSCEQNRTPAESEYLNRVFIDFECTTSDSSDEDVSDVSTEAFISNQMSFPEASTLASIYQSLRKEKKNKKHPNVVLSGKPQEDEQRRKDCWVITHRGVCFSQHMKKRDRTQETKRLDTHKKHVTLSPYLRRSFCRKALGIDETAVDENNLKKTSPYKELTRIKKELKKTASDQVVSQNGRRWHELLKDYIYHYNVLFSERKIVHDYGYPHPYNPFVSTSFLVDKALCYASGLRIDEEDRLRPHYRLSTGRAKHPVIGFVSSFAFPVWYFERSAETILRLHTEGLIGLNYFFKWDSEVVFYRYIPKKYLQSDVPLLWPDCSDQVSRWYNHLPAPVSHAGGEALWKKVVFWHQLSETQGMATEQKCLKKMVDSMYPHIKDYVHASVHATGHVPVYPFSQCQYTSEPVRPRVKGEWGDIVCGACDASKLSRRKAVLLHDESGAPVEFDERGSGKSIVSLMLAQAKALFGDLPQALSSSKSVINQLKLSFVGVNQTLFIRFFQRLRLEMRGAGSTLSENDVLSARSLYRKRFHFDCAWQRMTRRLLVSHSDRLPVGLYKPTRECLNAWLFSDKLSGMYDSLNDLYGFCPFYVSRMLARLLQLRLFYYRDGFSSSKNHFMYTDGMATFYKMSFIGLYNRQGLGSIHILERDGCCVLLKSSSVLESFERHNLFFSQKNVFSQLKREYSLSATATQKSMF